ncbi:MAG: secretin N-terminal domain-containing protein [Candidatus Zixiibacteriota bacterium]
MKNMRNSKYYRICLLAVVCLGIFGLAVAEEKDPTKPIENLTFQGAEIRSVIRFLADYGQVNVVVAPKVQGTVTINLKNVMWDQALDIIGATYNLSVVSENAGYIRVLPADDYRKEQSEISKHQFEQLNQVKLDMKIVRLANTAADEIMTSVKSLLTDRGKVESDAHTNALIIQEVPENMTTVEAFIKELDRPARQIKISAQLLEIYSTEGLDLGVSWDASGTYTHDATRSITQTGEQNGDVALPFAKYNVTATMAGWDLSATVATILSEGKGKLIAHPEITTIENKEARIQMGQKIPVKQFDESGNVVIKFEEVGTILKVTPHITADNQILMHLLPERSTLEFDPNGIIINTNNAETNVVVNNGQTAVIGGLTKQDESTSITGIPILKDIPLLGAIFRYETKSTENRDLVIFVTPTIVENDLAEAGP